MRVNIQEGYEPRGFMIRLYPTEEQIETIEKIQRDLRFVWNSLVSLQKNNREGRCAYAERNGLVGPRPPTPEPGDKKGAHALGAWTLDALRATKDQALYLSHMVRDAQVKHDYQLFQRLISIRHQLDGEENPIRINAHVLQALGKDFDQKATRSKTFRKRDCDMPFRDRSSAELELGDFGARGGRPSWYNCRVTINKLKIRGRLPGRVPTGRVMPSVAIRREADGWWASFKEIVPVRTPPACKPGLSVGLDMGLDYISTMVWSDGRETQVANPRGREFSDTLAELQKQKKPTGRLHQRGRKHVRNIIYSDIVKAVSDAEHIFVENLSVEACTQHGSVKVSVMRTVIRILKERFGDRVREVPCFYSSQTCSRCGVVDEKSWAYTKTRLGRCVSCGHVEDRDLNAARNTLAWGLKSLNSCAA